MLQNLYINIHENCNRSAYKSHMKKITISFQENLKSIELKQFRNFPDYYYKHFLTQTLRN